MKKNTVVSLEDRGSFGDQQVTSPDVLFGNRV